MDKTHQYNIKIFRLVCLLAFFLQIFSIPLNDLFFYRHLFRQILYTRIFAFFFIAANYFFIQRVPQKYFNSWVVTAALLSSINVTVICRLPNEGLATMYSIGQYFFLILVAFFIFLPTSLFICLQVTGLVQHFIILSMNPVAIKYLMINVYYLTAAAVLGYFLYRHMRTLYLKSERMEEMRFVCADCLSERKNEIEDSAFFHYDGDSGDYKTHFCSCCGKNTDRSSKENL